MDEDTKLKTLGYFDLIPWEDGVVHEGLRNLSDVGICALIVLLSAFSV